MAAGLAPLSPHHIFLPIPNIYTLLPWHDSHALQIIAGTLERIGVRSHGIYLVGVWPFEYSSLPVEPVGVLLVFEYALRGM